MKHTVRKKVLLGVVLGVPALCILAMLASYLSNRTFAQRSAQTDLLSAQEKAQMAEYYHLKASQGGQIWPGFGEQASPVILYNEDYAFLVGMQSPPKGWVKVPDTNLRGGDWVTVPGDDFDGQPYYRQRVADPGLEIGAFTVKVGEVYVPSLATLEWMRIGLANQLRSELPPGLNAVFPYRIFPIGTFTADWHVAGLEHEAFHAFQGRHAPQRLDAAELAERNFGQPYGQAAGAMEESWKNEFDLLSQAMGRVSDEGLADLARQFLALRAQRRSQTGLSADLVQYEREREWLEGLAKYVELELWRAGWQAGPGQTLAVPAGVESVDGYRNFERNWNEQVRQLGQQSVKEGDGRFYYSGWVQAVMLDRLAPGWKNTALEPGIYLEDLLMEAVGAN